CNDSLNAKTVNVKSVSAMCAKCVMIHKHDLCVPKSVAKPLRKTVASESTKKPINNVRKLHEHFGKIYKWSYIKFTPSGYMWKPKSTKENVNPNISKPLGNTSRTANVKDTMTSRRSFVSNTPLSSNSFTAHRDCPIHRLNHNLFSVSQFCDADMEVAFRKSTCFIRDLKGYDLLTGSRETDLYSITLQSTSSPNPICLMAKATSSQAWLWHRRLSHLNFDTINLLFKNDIVIDQNDEDVDLVKERELLASLIEKLKCEIDESKNRNKFLETSNKVLIDKLKSEIKDFKNKNNSLELSNNQFKEANNKLYEENDLLYADFKKSQAKLKRRDSIEYASEMELECAKVRGDFLSYKMESQKS
nr:integrase, catalytic region, zinc finger, CCHC-type, peptidase aspartic, catalytic [Tanacetum cinerariifolium]